MTQQIKNQKRNQPKYQQILKKRYIKQLNHLNLILCEESWKQIMYQYNWQKLQTLSLGKCKLKGQDIKIMTILSLKNLKQLRLCTQYLILYDNPIGSQGIRILIKADLPFLQSLCISQCLIGDQGILIMSKAFWPKLNKLYIGNNKFNASGPLTLGLCNFSYLDRIYMGEFDQQLLFWFSHPITVLGYMAIKSKCQIMFGIKNTTLKQIIKNICNQKLGR